MCRGLFPVVEKIVIKAVAVTEIGALSWRDHIQRMMDFFEGFFFDTNLFRCLRVSRKKPVIKTALFIIRVVIWLNVETVVLLSQQKPDDHIEIEINLDEIDATSTETKATYKEIQDWVQEKYGFHVTNLNIAQVKQIHGIIERENYDKPKSENSRQPGCPEEKVKAILHITAYVIAERK